jgi:hypothetical protein
MSKGDQMVRSELIEEVKQGGRSPLLDRKIKIKSEKINTLSISTPKFSLNMNLNDVEKICSVILEKIIQINQNFKKDSNYSLAFNSTFVLSKYSIFESEDLPKAISIYDYIKRISSYIKFDKYILILSMMNLDKFLEQNKDFVLTKLNCYKLVKIFNSS